MTSLPFTSRDISRVSRENSISCEYMDTTRQQLTQRIEKLPLERLRWVLLSWAESSDELSIEALLQALTDGNDQDISVQTGGERSDEAVEKSETNHEFLLENAAGLRKEADIGLQAYRGGDFDDITAPEDRRRVLREIRESAKAEALLSDHP